FNTKCHQIPMRPCDQSPVYPVQMSTQVYPALEGRSAHLQRHLQYCRLQQSTDTGGVPWANPKGTTVHTRRGVDFAVHLTGPNADRIEESRQDGPPFSLVR